MLIKKPRFWDSEKISIYSIILYPISIIYFFLLTIIKKFKKNQNFEIPIVCVGNIYLGGTGKTPLVYEIYNILNSIGKNPAIIKKYYNYLEDEISLLKSKSIVFSEKNRSLAIKELINLGWDVFIISHKSLYPYKGPKYDLHDAAMRWLDKNNFFNKSGLDSDILSIILLIVNLSFCFG